MSSDLVRYKIRAGKTVGLVLILSLAGLWAIKNDYDTVALGIMSALMGISVWFLYPATIR